MSTYASILARSDLAALLSSFPSRKPHKPFLPLSQRPEVSLLAIPNCKGGWNYFFLSENLGFILASVAQLVGHCPPN